jgi:hypothetical protein
MSLPMTTTGYNNIANDDGKAINRTGVRRYAPADRIVNYSPFATHLSSPDRRNTASNMTAAAQPGGLGRLLTSILSSKNARFSRPGSRW